MGLGFKARNQLDLQIQKFDTERITLMNNRINLSPDQFKAAWAELEQKYQFADLVMLSRRSGWERDTSYVYHVLGRLPPGNKNDYYESAGLSREMIDAFYQSKGDALGEWQEADIRTFMDGILNLGAILQTPDDATQAEWDYASGQYSQYIDTIEQLFGADIQDKINMYYQIREDDIDVSYAYLELHPEITDAWDLKARMIEAMPGSPFAMYYGSLSSIRSFYKGQMRSDIVNKLGDGIYTVMNAYWDLPKGSNERRQYRRLHPEIGSYYDIWDDWNEIINRRIIAIGGMLQVGQPAQFRDTNLSFAQQSMLVSLSSSKKTPSDFTSLDWEKLTGFDYSAVTSWLYNKQEISFDAEQRLSEVAEELDMSLNELLQLIGISLQ